MEKEFVTYEQALALKELGFDEECFAWYNYGELLEFSNDHILDMYAGEDKRPIAPLKQQVFRWFQNKYNWYHTMDFRRKEYPSTNQYKWKIDIGLGDVFPMGWADTYEEAENACIDKLIEISKQQDND
jgi:hypothetical protein